MSKANATEPHQMEWYDKSFVPFQSSQIDARFPYMMYVPPSYDVTKDKEYPLVVLMHGTERAPHIYLENNAKFADKNDIILLAPLFPLNTHGNRDLENYKLIDYKGTRYDLILLSMVDEVRSKYRIKGDKFNLFGFSGGGHFAHRFFYLHPHRLNALSIGAPGMVTFIDETSDWWVGTRDLHRKFNARLNFKKMSEVKVQMVIGEQDIEGWEDEIEEWSPYKMGENVKGATYNSAGKNRQKRMKNLKKNFEEHGVKVTMEIVPDAGHDEVYMFPSMQKFFLKHIK
ncbi:MAG: hypothetical protein JKY84_01045 [Emcibacteraceae bacterium]|nr:hypothetical protein [Emcibacteraceae bacterium]